MSAKVLIVDDEKDFLDIMAERMAARGMDVSTATSAEIALKMVQEESYDAVIMDLLMPEMDGFTALKLFKEANPEVSVILQTANAPEETLARLTQYYIPRECPRNEVKSNDSI